MSMNGANMKTKGREFEVFYDGDCPLCMKEIAFLQKRDRNGRIQFTDIADPSFQPSNYGKNHDELMAEIHGRLPDGTWVTGVEVFRQLYDAVGFGPVVMATRLPLISQILNFGYKVFARNRLRLTGRCSSNTCRV